MTKEKIKRRQKELAKRQAKISKQRIKLAQKQDDIDQEWIKLAKDIERLYPLTDDDLAYI